MIQEYLFTDDIKINDEKELSLCGFVPEIEPIKNSDCKIVKYISAGNSVEDAKSLSSVNETIMDKYKPTVLTNESSAYFNKRLYPLFNEFERKLRKLLYLKSALYKNKDDVKAIDNLEGMDFGELFELLFIDTKCMSETKDYVKKYKFSSASLIRHIREIEENTLWKKLFSDGAVSDFEGEYDTVRKHRNDVMHAHNVTYTNYKEALKLIQIINEELDSEIGKTIGLKESNQTAPNVDYNKVINETIASKKTVDYLNSIQGAYENYMTQIDESMPSISKESIEQINELAKYYNSPEAMALQRLAYSPEVIKMAEYQREMQDLVNSSEFKELIEIEQSPAMAKLREMNMRIQANIDPSVYAYAYAASSFIPKSGDDNSTTKTGDGKSNVQAKDTIDKKDDEE